MFILLHLEFPSKNIGFFAISNHSPENFKIINLKKIKRKRKNAMSTSRYLKLRCIVTLGHLPKPIISLKLNSIKQFDKIKKKFIDKKLILLFYCIDQQQKKRH